MSSVDILEASPPEVPGAMQAADVPDALLNQLMDQHDAVNQLQNLQLQSGSGSQGTDTEGAIPHQQGTCSPASPSNFTETMDDSDHRNRQRLDRVEGTLQVQNVLPDAQRAPRRVGIVVRRTADADAEREAGLQIR